MLDAIDNLTRRTDPGAGGFYDNLGAVVDAGEPNPAPRLNPGEGVGADPSFFFTPLPAGPVNGCRLRGIDI